MKEVFKKSLLASLFIFLLVSSSFAQRQTGTLTGSILDEEGNPLPGANITITSESLMGTQSAVSSANGVFRFPNLPPGTYSLKAELPGFQTVIRSNIIVHVGMVVNVEIRMKAVAIEEEVMVTAPSPVIDTRQSRISVTVDEQLIKNLPVRRDIHDLINMVPGASFSESSG